MSAQGLAGKRIVLTRPRDQALAMAEFLRRHDATPILFPTIEIVPVADMTNVDRAIDALSEFQWLVFTSVNGVTVFADRCDERTGCATMLGRARIAAIGPATAGELTRRGATPEFVPEEFIADRIPEGMGDVRGQSILLPRAARARQDLARELEHRGAIVYDLPVYDTRAPTVDDDALEEIASGVDAVTFTSSSTVEHFAELTGTRCTPLLERATVACIGPITAGTAERLGIRVDVVAQEYTTMGLLESLGHHFNGRDAA
jgi:uroporphyrinogen III methyltransferase/synthase